MDDTTLKTQIEQNINHYETEGSRFLQSAKVLKTHLNKLNNYPNEVLELYSLINNLKSREVFDYKDLFIQFDKINKILHNYKFSGRMEDVINDVPEGTKGEINE